VIKRRRKKRERESIQKHHLRNINIGRAIRNIEILKKIMIRMVIKTGEEKKKENLPKRKEKTRKLRKTTRKWKTKRRMKI